MAAEVAHATAQGLPFTVEQLKDLGGLTMAFVLGAAGYLRGKKAAVPDGDAKTVAVAMAAPLGEPNQLRQIVDAMNRLGDFAEHGLKVLEEVRDGQDRTVTAIGHVEEAAGRAAAAARDVDASLNRLPRR